MRPLRLLLLVALATVGCKKTPPVAAPPQIVEVRVVDRTPVNERVGLDTELLAQHASAAIGKSSGLPVTDGGVTPSRAPGRRYKLRIEVRTEGGEDPATHKGVMRVLVSARLAPLGEEGWLIFEQTAVGERLFDLDKRGDAMAAWRTHAERSIEDVLRGLGARVKLADGDVATVIAALDGADDDLREEATRIAGERREKRAVPSLLKLLKSEDRDTRDRAIGALSAIGDVRAVRPLTEVARFRDLGDLPKILDALAAIGGDESRAYLEFVASGHESVEIRDLAKQALEHLERRQRRDLGAGELPRSGTE
jgi:hypothetical protein